MSYAVAHPAGYLIAQSGYAGEVAVLPGPRLLAGILNGPVLSAHRATWPEPPHLSEQHLLGLLKHGQIHGRGGAGFPFVRKLSTAVESGRRRELIINASEGEPGSAKDSSLLITAPHLVLDGAEIVARALGVKKIRMVLPSERPSVVEAARSATEERSRSGAQYDLYVTGGTFVGGQARAVIELIEGRDNLPVTSWEPEAVRGLGGRPTLLSNAETYAQVAALVGLGASAYAHEGMPSEPGTTLLTIAGDGPGGIVLEVPFGVRLADVLLRCGYEPTTPLLVGGYHGAWLTPEEVQRRRVSRADLADAGAALGAGVMLPIERGWCPVVLTARIVEYLAGQSAQRCGPCRFGLPALADAMGLLADGGVGTATERAAELAGMVTGRGSCAHPDGTARLVRSLLKTFPAEVAAHEQGYCEVSAKVGAR